MRKNLIGLRDRAVLKIFHWLKLAEARENERQARLVLSSLKLCGEDVQIDGPIRLSGAHQLEVGNNVRIGENAFIRAEGGLTIGNNVRISRNLLLYTVNHRFDGKRLPYDDKTVHKPVAIGNNVWIGMNVCIAPGTTIGDGAIIGMGTTVSGTVPPLAIVGSQKWRVLGFRDEEHYQNLAQTFGEE